MNRRSPFRRVALPRLLYINGQRDLATSRYRRELAEQPDILFLLRELDLVHWPEGSALELQRLNPRIPAVPFKAAMERRSPRFADVSKRRQLPFAGPGSFSPVQVRSGP